MVTLKQKAALTSDPASEENPGSGRRAANRCGAVYPPRAVYCEILKGDSVSLVSFRRILSRRSP